MTVKINQPLNKAGYLTGQLLNINKLPAKYPVPKKL